MQSLCLVELVPLTACNPTWLGVISFARAWGLGCHTATPHVQPAAAAHAHAHAPPSGGAGQTDPAPRITSMSGARAAMSGARAARSGAWPWRAKRTAARPWRRCSPSGCARPSTRRSRDSQYTAESRAEMCYKKCMNLAAESRPTPVTTCRFTAPFRQPEAASGATQAPRKNTRE